jgi:hypothetical protein
LIYSENPCLSKAVNIAPGTRLRIGSAILSRAIALGVPAGMLRLDFLPEGFVGNAAARSKSLSSGFQDRLQFRRVPHEQALDVLFGL